MTKLEMQLDLPRSAHAAKLVTALIVTVVAIVGISGCDSKTSAEKLREAGFDPASRAVSFVSIADQFNNLDQAVKARDEARVPADIIVDATKSTDQQPVLGGVTDGPTTGGEFSILSVPQRNVNFINRGVAAGDNIEYFVQIPNPESPLEVKRQPVRFWVAEVIDATSLRIIPPLPSLPPGEAYPPFPIVISRISQQSDASPLRKLSHWQISGQPAIGWEPTPDRAALDQLVIQLNQWAERDDTDFAWQADPFIAALPKAQQTEFTDLAADRYATEDARLLQETVWLRDIARRAVAGGSELEQAQRLFDWTVRNVQIETRQSMAGVRQRPWQALISSRATADERAWVFILLLRQLNIDAVAIGFPALPGEPAKSTTAAWENISAVAVRSDDAWYLFDPALGIPIPGPEGKGIATLAEAKENPAVLRQLDVSNSDSEESSSAEASPASPFVYPFTNEHAKQAVAFVEATPIYLAKRMRRIELQLAGENRMVLSTSPSRIAEAIRPHVAEVKLWTINADTLAAQQKTTPGIRAKLAEQYRAYAGISALWKGRVLQFKGSDHRLELDYADRPVRVYVRQRDPRWYYTQYCRPSDADLAEANPAEFDVASLRYAKQMATVWMGIVSLEDSEYGEALAYFDERTLSRTETALLAALARLNLAETHVQIAKLLDKLSINSDESNLVALAIRVAAAEERQAAVKLYEADNSPQRHGSLLRAKALK